MLQSCLDSSVLCLGDHGSRVLVCRDELLEIGRKPGLSTLPQGVNMNVIRCVVRSLFCMIQLAIAARGTPGWHSLCSTNSSSSSLQEAPSSLHKGHNRRCLSCCRELEELTFFDSGPKPEWGKEKAAGFGRLDFLRPGELLSHTRPHVQHTCFDVCQ